MNAAKDDPVLTYDEVADLAQRVLRGLGLSAAHAEAMARVIAAGQRDACPAHGVYRLITCAQTLRAGKVNCVAEPSVDASAGAIVSVDAHYGFSPLAFARGLPLLVESARRNGIAAMVIRHCFHFSALWPEVEEVGAHGLAALAMNPSHSWVAPAGGGRPVFGTNPIAFAWPRAGRELFVFDFATSAIARGDLELHRRSATPLPPGVGVDADGQPSTDPLAVARGAMLTFGGHKGSALAAMVELLAGALIGDWTSTESQAFDAGAGAAPCHGELIVAFDPQRFGGDAAGVSAGQRSAEAMFAAITGQGARLPSQRRFAARAASLANGITIPRALYDEILALTG